MSVPSLRAVRRKSLAADGRALDRDGEHGIVQTPLQSDYVLHSASPHPARFVVLTYASTLVRAGIARSCHALRTVSKEKRGYLGGAIRCCARDPTRDAAPDRATGARG